MYFHFMLADNLATCIPKATRKHIIETNVIMNPFKITTYVNEQLVYCIINDQIYTIDICKNIYSVKPFTETYIHVEFLNVNEYYGVLKNGGGFIYMNGHMQYTKYGILSANRVNDTLLCHNEASQLVLYANNQQIKKYESMYDGKKHMLPYYKPVYWNDYYIFIDNTNHLNILNSDFQLVNAYFDEFISNIFVYDDCIHIATVKGIYKFDGTYTCLTKQKIDRIIAMRNAKEYVITVGKAVYILFADKKELLYETKTPMKEVGMVHTYIWHLEQGTNRLYINNVGTKCKIDSLHHILQVIHIKNKIYFLHLSKTNNIVINTINMY